MTKTNPFQSLAKAVARASGSSTGAHRSFIQWRIAPMTTVYGYFDLAGLGDPFHKLLGYKSRHTDLYAMIELLEQQGESLKRPLTQRLDTDWAACNLTGVALMYPWPALRESLVEQASVDDDLESIDWLDDETASVPLQPVTVLRALDISLVLNVLSRSRSFLLLANEPPFFEHHYWRRTLATDDARLIALVQATGCEAIKP